MRPQARRAKREQRWISQAEDDIERLRERLRAEPGNESLAALVRMGEEVIAHQRQRLNAAGSMAP